MRIGNSTRLGKPCLSLLRNPIDVRQTGRRRIGRRCGLVTPAVVRSVSHLHAGRLHRCGWAADPTVAAFPAIALFCNLPAAAFSATASFCQAGSGRSIRHALDSRSCHGRLTATELAANLAWEAVPDSNGEHRHELRALPEANGGFDVKLRALPNRDRQCRCLGTRCRLPCHPVSMPTPTSHANVTNKKLDTLDLLEYSPQPSWLYEHFRIQWVSLAPFGKSCTRFPA